MAKTYDVKLDWQGPRYRRQLYKHLERVAERATNHGVEIAKTKVPVLTGHLRSTIGQDIRGSLDRGKAIYQLMATAPYAAIVDRRTGYLADGAQRMIVELKAGLK